MSYSKKALLLSTLCIVYCILYESVLTKYEALNDFMHALGIVFNCVALSIIASCIFYFITDYLPQKHQYDKTREYITSNLDLLGRIGINAFIDIANNSNPTKQEFINCCDVDLMRKNKSCNQENLIFAHINNWFEYFDCMQRIETCIIQRLMIFESMLPIDVRLKFINLQKEGTIFSDSKTYIEYYNEDKKQRSIKVYADDVFEHINTLVELKRIYNLTSKI